MRELVVKEHRWLATVILILLTLGACQTFDLTNAAQDKAAQVLLHKSIPEQKIYSEQRRLAAEGLLALDERRYDDASDSFNRAVQLEIRNSYLQFLNGLAYHLRALKGNSALFSLSEEGYKQALQFDPTNNIARQYLGLLHFDQRNYPAAQKHFAESLVYDEDDVEILYSLAVASYFAQDPETAAGALEILRKRKPKEARFLNASSVVMAALNRPIQARVLFDKFRTVSKDRVRLDTLEKRLSQWQRFHAATKAKSAATRARLTATGGDPIVLAQQQTDSSEGDESSDREESEETEETEETEESEEDQEPPPVDENQMVIVDVVIIRTEEDISTRKGINLLNGLTLQFGSGDAPAFSVTRESIKSPAASVGLSKTITRAITIPAITYSLNIFNSNTNRNEILARPTLVALAGETSEFFSGVEINAAAVGGAASDGSVISIDKEVGVKLAITPTFLDDGRVKLVVVAERTFLATPNTTSVIFQFRIDTSKTTVNATVVMNFGETLILSGLSEKETERARDGVPLLQDIPIIQYFFSEQTTRDFQKSVLILLTPRRPQFVHRSAKSQNLARDSLPRDERVLFDLQARYSDSFRPYPNWASVFHHMQNNSLYREFRTGDVTLETWVDQTSHFNRLKKALEFLYY